MVLGCGFGMGHVAFVDFAKGYGLDVSLVEANDLVTAWRDANQNIRKFWWDLDAAAKRVIRGGRQSKVEHMSHGLRVGLGMDQRNNDVLLIELPSKRMLWYRNPRIVTDPVQPQHDSIQFDGVDQYTKKWGPIRTWGSKLAENITQAVARDIICEAALRVSGHVPGTELVLSVHDELLFEVPQGFSHEVSVKRWIEQAPPWANGLPIEAKGGMAERYGKG